MNATLSNRTYDEIVDSWGRDNGLGRDSGRWCFSRGQALVLLDQQETRSLADYLDKRISLLAGPGIERERGQVARLRKDAERVRDLTWDDACVSDPSHQLHSHD